MKLEIQNANYNYLDNSQYLLNSNNSINSYVIKTQPVQSTNSRVIQQQCAMTNEETRSLTGVVAKTRALFENSSNCDYSSPVCPLGREISSSTRQFNSNLRTNTSYNKSFMKPSFSANNVNNIVPKLKLNSVGSINENESDKENTKANNRFAKSPHINHLANLFNSTTPSSNNGSLTTSANYAINHHKINSSAHNLTNDCFTANNISNENLINDTRLNQDSIFKPTFLKLRRFESSSLSQSHLLDHINDSQNYINNSSRSSHSNQPPTMTQSLIQNKSTSSNRISLASSSTSSASSSSVANELAHTISKFKPSYNNNNGLWSSSIETSKELNIPTSVKQAKACFESLAASNSSLNILNKAKTNSTTSSVSLNTPNKQPNPNSVSKVRSDLLLSSKYPNGGARIPPMYPTPPQSAQQTNQFKSTVIPITNQRKSSSPSPLNESSNNNNSEMLVKSYSSSNGLVGVSEMINLFSSSSSSNSSTNNSNYNSLTSRNVAAVTANNQLMIPSSSSSSSSPIYNSNSSASSCETTPRSSELQQATTVATYPVSVSIPISRSLNLDSELNETPLILNENHHDDEFKLPNVAERIRNLEKSSVSVSSLRNNYLKLASANNDYLNSQSENVVVRAVNNNNNKMGSTPSSSSSASSFSSSSSYLNNSNLSNNTANKTNDQSLNKYSPKFVKAYQRFEDNQNKYRKLEDIINEADSSNSTIIKIKSPSIENQAHDNELDENEPEQKPALANIKSILRKAAITPSPVCFSLNKPVETMQQIQVYHAEVNSQKTLPININRIVQECTTVYSSSIEKPNNNMYNIVENRKNSLKKLQETNYDRLNFVGSNGNEDSQVKVDSTSCVLPSKLRQNSQSLADPCEDLPKNHSTPKTPLCRNTAKTGSYVKNASPHLNGSSFNTSTSGSSVVKR